MKKATAKSKFSTGLGCPHVKQCQILGYCLQEKRQEIERELLKKEKAKAYRMRKKEEKKEAEIRKQEEEKAYRMSDTFIAKWLPLDVPVHVSYHIGDYSRAHLQTALDAYHHKDYETAILHCKAVIDGNCSCRIAYICIIASEYFSSNYEDATYYATRAEEHYDSPEALRVLQLFNLHCVNLLREKAKSEQRQELSERVEEGNAVYYNARLIAESRKKEKDVSFNAIKKDLKRKGRV